VLELLDDREQGHAGGERRPDHGRLGGAVQALQLCQQPVDLLHAGEGTLSTRMALADDFQEIIDSLPSDWTNLELDVRVDESQYLEAATIVSVVNAQPYSHHDWHWRILVAHHFGHAAAAPAVHGMFVMLDKAGIRGELILRELREGRIETVNTWGRPESVRQEFRRIRSQ
jgi:hypothetical protein